MRYTGNLTMPLRSTSTLLSLSCVVTLSCGLLLTGLATAQDHSEEWALHGHGYSNQRFSSLNEINTHNVDQLTSAWTYHSGINATFQTTPIVTHGVMYLSLPFSGVAAVDAKTGEEKWKYKHVSRWKSICCGPANRGVAVDHDKVFIGTVDGRLVALNAKTGSPIWDVSVAEQTGSTESSSNLNKDDPLSKAEATGSTGIGISMAPIVHHNKVFVAVNGVGYGLHPDKGLAVVGITTTRSQSGFMAAFDAKTGKRLWKWEVTGPGWEGDFKNSTGDGVPMHRDIEGEKKALSEFSDAWRYGGGSIYASPAIDRERGLLIFGTGNPSPQMADDSRPGDNLHTSSLVALNLKTGKLVWAYQQIPHDRWGYDVSTPPVLMTLKVKGQKIPAVASPSKLGWVYVHDRRNGKFLFKSEPFVPQSNLLAEPTTGEGVVIAPGIAGGSNWSPAAYDRKNGLLFVPALHLPTRYISHKEVKDGQEFSYVSTQDGDEKGGTLTALDLQHKGAIRWQEKTSEPMIGGVLATSGNVIFTGSGQHHFSAYDSLNGSKLWDVELEAGVNAPPVTWKQGHHQMVAVAVGGNALFGLKTGDTVAAFMLPDQAQTASHHKKHHKKI